MDSEFEQQIREEKTPYLKLIIAPIILAIVGVMVFYYLTFIPLKQAAAAKKWVQVPCKIISIRTECRKSRTTKTSYGSHRDTKYGIKVSYEYGYEGQIYKSERYAFRGGKEGERQKMDEIVEEYKTAKSPVCLVNPEDPSEAVLKAEANSYLLWGTIALLIAFICLAELVFVSVRSLKSLGSIARKNLVR